MSATGTLGAAYALSLGSIEAEAVVISEADSPRSSSKATANGERLDSSRIASAFCAPSVGRSGPTTTRTSLVNAGLPAS